MTINLVGDLPEIGRKWIDETVEERKEKVAGELGKENDSGETE